MAPQTAISKAVCYKTKNEQLWEKAVHFFLLPPTVVMQVYQLFFAPLPGFLGSTKNPGRQPEAFYLNYAWNLSKCFRWR